MLKVKFGDDPFIIGPSNRFLAQLFRFFEGIGK